MISNPMGTSNVFGGRFVAVPEWAIAYINKNGTPRDLQVLTCLVSMINYHDKSVSISAQDISGQINASKETVKRSLKWLVDNNIVSVQKNKKPFPNTYTVHYTDRLIGSSVTPTRVMGDPINVSSVTPSAGGDRVTHDPIKQAITPAYDLFFEKQIIILLLEKKITRSIERGCAHDGKVESMILGQDMTEQPKTAPTKEAKKTRPEVNELASHFVYHPRSVMNCSYSFQDMNILRRTIKLLLESGLTRVTIKKMIDKFFSTDNMRSADSPVLMFSSKAVQQSLMDSIETVLDEDSPVLSLMLNDFNRTGIALPWDQSEDESIKKIIIINGLDACYRYPEVVAQILETTHGLSVNGFKIKLSALNALVRWHLGEDDSDPEVLKNALASITLPKELLAKTRTTIRPPADTIVGAIYNYRRLCNGKLQ